MTFDKSKTHHIFYIYILPLLNDSCDLLPEFMTPFTDQIWNKKKRIMKVDEFIECVHKYQNIIPFTHNLHGI